MENLFPQEGLLSVIILLKSSIFPLTFMVVSWLPSRTPGPGRGFLHKHAVIALLLTINPTRACLSGSSAASPWPAERKL